jgi:hypothetical protein
MMNSHVAANVPAFRRQHDYLFPPIKRMRFDYDQVSLPKPLHNRHHHVLMKE